MDSADRLSCTSCSSTGVVILHVCGASDEDYCTCPLEECPHCHEARVEAIGADEADPCRECAYPAGQCVCTTCGYECGCANPAEHDAAEAASLRDFLRDPGSPPAHFTPEQVARAERGIAAARLDFSMETVARVLASGKAVR